MLSNTPRFSIKNSVLPFGMKLCNPLLIIGLGDITQFVVNYATMVIRIQEKKQEQYTNFTWFNSVSTSLKTTT